MRTVYGYCGGTLRTASKPVGYPGLRQELLGSREVVGHRLRHVHEVGIQRVDVRPEDTPEPEHRPFHDLRLVDGVRDRAPDAHVGERLLPVVERQDDVARGFALDELQGRRASNDLDRLRPQAEGHHVDVSRLEGGQRGVRVGYEAERDPVELRQPLDVIVRVALEDDAVATVPALQHERPGSDRLRLQLIHRLARVDHRPLPRQIVEEHRVVLLEARSSRCKGPARESWRCLRTAGRSDASSRGSARGRGRT